MNSQRQLNELSFRRATGMDLPPVEALLAQNSLATVGAAESIEGFWLAEWQGGLVGIAGLELYRDAALLRSVAVTAEWRGQGLARALIERTLESAASAGVREVYLLTTTAAEYFPRIGFKAIAREAAPASIRDSLEFREACPATAVCLMKPLAVRAGS